MRKFILMSAFALILAGCIAVQRTDDAGNLVLDEQDEPIVDQKFDVDTAVGAASALGPFVGGPFGAAIPIIASLLPLFRKKG